MALPITVDRIKRKLRISGDVHNAEIKDEIDECVADLKMHGIDADEGNETIIQAIKLYCLAGYTADATRSQMYWERYTTMREYLKMGCRGDSDE